MNKPVYLACPYSDPDPAVRRRRFKTANHVAMLLMRMGIVVYSPVSHSHPIQQEFKRGATSWEFWKTIDTWALVNSAELWVLCLPGWKDSEGIRAEMTIARERDIPIFYVLLRGDTVHVTVQRPSE